MANLVKMLAAALPEDSSLVPSTDVGQLIIACLAPEDLTPSSGLHGHPYTHAQTYIHINIKKEKNNQKHWLDLNSPALTSKVLVCTTMPGS